MTSPEVQQTEPNQPVLLERGRYANEREADGSWFILRAAPICEACQSCGCGEQADPIHLPVMIVNLLTMDPEARNKLNPWAMVRKLVNGHGRTE